MRITTQKTEKLATDQIQQFINELVRAKSLADITYYSTAVEITLGDNNYCVEIEDLTSPKTISKLLNELDRLLKQGKSAYNHKLHIGYWIPTSKTSLSHGKVSSYLSSTYQNIDSGETLDLANIISQLEAANNSTHCALRDVHCQGREAIIRATQAVLDANNAEQKEAA